MKELTAIHEAAHSVLAYLSSYHFLTGEIKLTSDSTGVTFVTLSKKKLLATGKEVTPSIASELEVIEDAATIFYAGLEAERIFCIKNSLTLDESHSKNDYNYIENLFKNSNHSLEERKDLIIEFCRTSVLQNWEAIKEIADILIKSENNSIDSVYAIEFLDQGFGRNSFI